MKQTQQYLEFLEFGRKLSKNTIKSIEHDFTTFGEGLEQATRKDVERYVMDQNKKGMSTGTLARRVASIKGFFEWQQYNDYRVGLNPADGKIAPKIKNKSHEAISINLLDHLYQQAPTDTLKVAIALMGYAGMRLGEVVGIGTTSKTYRDENNELAIHLTETKGDKERSITLALAPNKELIEFADKSGGLMGKRGVLSTNGLWRQMGNYFKEMGHSDLSPHGLRATFSTISVTNGIRVDVVRDVMGHGSLQGNTITSQYVKVCSVEDQSRELLEGWC